MTKPKRIPVRKEKSSELQKLKNRIDKLEKENIRLKSDINTYKQAFNKTSKFLRDSTDELNVEKLIDAVKKDKTLKQAKKVDMCENCDIELTAIKVNNNSKILSCVRCGFREKINETDVD